MKHNITIDENFILRVIRSLYKRDYTYYFRARLMYIGNALVMMLMSGLMFFSLLFIPISTENPLGMMYLFIVFFISMIFSAIAVNYIDFYRRTRILGGGIYRIYTVLTCKKCNMSKIRPYKRNEYVGMLSEDTCPKCGEKMYVFAIFGEPEKEIKSVGIPLMAGSAVRNFILFLYSLLLRRLGYWGYKSAKSNM